MKVKLKGILTLFLALVVQISFAQEKTISGTVSDDSGALPGVSIIIKGTTAGTETDFNGKFYIKAKAGDVLSFSYIGYATVERTVGASSTINITMEVDDNVLDEVVVTALGIKREKRSLGFSQQSVKSENLARTRETDLNNALAGKIAGIQIIGAVGASFRSSSIRLRGDSDVLYVIDNVKVESISDINTDDIASLSVLKGSAATALYGPEGINGVVIITTKTAKPGESRVTINHSTAFESVYLLPEYQNEYGGGYSQDPSQKDTEFQGFKIFTYNPAKHPASWASFDKQKLVDYKADESWGPKLDGTLVRHWDSWIPGDPEFGKLRPFSSNSDNIKNFFDTGITNNISASFSKAGNDYSVRTSITNIDRTSIMPNSHRRTVQASINLSIDITDKLTAYTNINYQDRRTKNDPRLGYSNLGSNFNQWWQRQLDIDRLRSYRRDGQIVSWNINSPTNTKPLYWDSPFFEVYENLKFQTRNSTYGKIGVKYDISEDLNASLDLRKNFRSQEYNQRTAFGGLDTPSYRENEYSRYKDELFGIVNYNKNISSDLDVSASLGFELSTSGVETINASTVGGLAVPGLYTVGSSVDRPGVGTFVGKSKTRSIFGRASLGYKNFLYLDGSVRNDWGSTANPEDNDVDTYGVSLSFIFSKFLPTNDIISFGKIRVSSAQAPRFPLLYSLSQTFSVGTPYGRNPNLSTPGTYPNPELKGGTRKDYEIGTELKLFNNKVNIDVAYFKKVDTGLPVAITLDGATGFGSTTDNDGEQTYKGIEVAIDFNVLKNEDFEWSTTMTLATLDRFVNKISDSTTVNNLASSWRGITLREETGKEWGAIYGRAFRRDPSGAKILSSSGTPRYDSNEYLGNILPNFSGGFSNNFRYKNFKLGFDIDFQRGGKVFSVTRMFNAYSGQGIKTVGNNDLGNSVRDAIEDGGGVLVEGVDETTKKPVSYHVNPKTYWGNLFALHERWLFDASYVKLRTIRLDYTLPNEFLSKTKIPFKSINLGVYVNNVLLIYSDIPGLDPSEIEQVRVNQRDVVSWTEGGQLPNVRTVGFNLKISL